MYKRFSEAKKKHATFLFRSSLMFGRLKLRLLQGKRMMLARKMMKRWMW